MFKSFNTHDTNFIIERNGKNFFSGYAAVWDDGTDETQYFVGTAEGTPIYERFQKNCFNLDDAIEIWFNHDPDFRMGSNQGNLTLRNDEKGLLYELEYDENNANHVFVKSQFNQKLIHGSSIGFNLRRNPTWESQKNKDVYTVTKASLRDVGPVYYPAYKTAEAQFRSDIKCRSMGDTVPDDILKSWKTWKRFSKIS